MYYVYQTTNMTNQKIYVGVHKGSETDSYMGSGVWIERAIAKYGRDKFKKDILCAGLSKEEAYALEAQIVNEEFLKRSDVYNFKLGGHGGFDHINNDPEIRAMFYEKSRQTMANKTPEELKRISKLKARNGEKNYWYGKDRSGENNPRFGVKMEPETLAKIKAGQQKALREGRWSTTGGARTREGLDAISKANSREFKLVDPNGVITTIVNLAKFAKDNGLSEACLRSVEKGRNGSHKGWTKP